jgi:hypothetical protein
MVAARRRWRGAIAGVKAEVVETAASRIYRMKATGGRIGTRSYTCPRASETGASATTYRAALALTSQ